MQLKKSVVDLVKDKKYVENMQRIEEKLEKSNRDVVTISGLVISKLCRFENECKSVLNLWEPTSYSKVEEEARTPIENAVCSLINSIWLFSLIDIMKGYQMRPQNFGYPPEKWCKLHQRTR